MNSHAETIVVDTSRTNETARRCRCRQVVVVLVSLALWALVIGAARAIVAAV
jgi:hypothetical protein